MQCKITKFKPETIKPGRIIFIVGKRGCGKSTLLRELLSRVRDDVDYAMAMCPTMESAEMFRSCMPRSSVYDRYVPGKVEQLVAVAQHFAAAGKKRRLLLCLDDCLYDRNVLKSPTIRSIFFNGRHSGISLIVSAQYMMDLGPDLRTNIDYLFVMKENIISNRQKLWKYLFGCVPTFDDFCAIMDRCTQNYECLCLDNTLAGGTVPECVFWYKAATDLSAFEVGRRIFFDMDERSRRCGSDGVPPLPPEEDGAPAPRGRRAALRVIKEAEREASDSDPDAR